MIIHSPQAWLCKNEQIIIAMQITKCQIETNIIESWSAHAALLAKLTLARIQVFSCLLFFEKITTQRKQHKLIKI